MVPYQTTGIERFVESHGPSATCKDKDGVFTFWPDSVEADDVLAQLGTQANAFVCGEKPKNLDKLEVIRKAIDGLTSIKVPSTETAAWIYDKHPELASGLNMVHAFRGLQAKTFKGLSAWTCKDMSKSKFLTNGFGGLMKELDDCLSAAKSYQSVATDTILKYQDQDSDNQGEFAECRALTKILLPAFRNVVAAITFAQNVRDAIVQCVVRKGSALLKQGKAHACDWDAEFRVWMGINDSSTKSNRLIKVHMLGKGEGAHRKTADRLNSFETIITDVAAAVECFEDLKAAVEESHNVLHEGRFYCACAGIVYNIVVKKSQKCPPETLKNAAKRCARAASAMNLWAKRSDGRESLPKDTPSVLISSGTSTGLYLRRGLILIPETPIS